MGGNMKKNLILFILTVMTCLVWASVSADSVTDFQWENYSYEELLEIKEGFDAVFSEKERAWLIEHGDRKITFETDVIQLYTNRSITITPLVTRLSDDAPAVTQFDWTSSDESVARVSVYGSVTAVGAGDAEITCTAKDNEHIFSSVKVQVILPVTEVRISEPRAVLLLSDDKDTGVISLSAEILPADAYCQDVTWSSSNESVALVGPDGVVTAVAPGTAVITAISDDAYSASYPLRAACTVTVQQAVTSIELDQTEFNMNQGTYVTLKTTVLPANATQKSLNWESSDPNVVRVNNGQLYAAGGGSAVITATATDGSGKTAVCRVNVIQMVSSVRFAESSQTLEMRMNEFRRLNVDVLPAHATNRNLQWQSSNEAVALVSPLGEVQVVGAGTAYILCSTVDGSDLTASLKIHVPSISVSTDKITVTSKSGLTFDVGYYGSSEANFTIENPGTGFFTLTKKWIPASRKFEIKILPIKAGTATVTLKDAGDSESRKSISITIDPQATYSVVSYPLGVYRDILRNPDRYNGKQISIRGKVVQKMEGWFGSVSLRVATDTYYFDDVYYVTYNQSDIDFNVIEDDFVTIYGICTGTKTYESIFGASITIPSMTAEKILSGFVYQ